MSTPTARLLLLPLIAAVAAVVLLLVTTPAGQAQDAGPYIQPDCFVADDVSADGPAAPSGLKASSAWYLYDAPIGLYWDDNSDDETCFVLERKPVGGDWGLDVVLSANLTSHSEFSPGGWYRIYAATETTRSATSNEVFQLAATPPPTPSPTPYPQSTIDLRYVSNGLPVEIWVFHFLLIADGVPCPQLQIGAVVKNDRFIMPWPLDDGSLPSACLKGPPTSVELQINGRILVEVEWTGADISQDVEVPLDMIAVPSITPSQQPNLTPAQLPAAGGGPPTASGIQAAVVLVVIGVIAVALSLSVARRRLQ